MSAIASYNTQDFSGRHVIIGGGIIGLSIGWQLARNGNSVTIIERDIAGHGASWVAAGMLPPYAEIGFEEVEFFQMCSESLALYPQLLAELASDLGPNHSVPKLDACGTLMIAMNADDESYLNRFHDFQIRIGLNSRTLSAAEAREREPLLSPRVKSALLLEGDKQIDNRMLVDALRNAFIACGGELVEHTETGIGAIFNAESIVVSAGAYASRVDARLKQTNPVRPVKGQIIRLQPTADIALRHMVRTPRVYLAQKESGRLVIGATAEEKGFDTTVTAGAVMDLLRNAWEAVPMTYELEVSEIAAGLRPATRTHLPYIGYSGESNIFYAIGHYRHGILLTPYTAYRMAEIIMDRTAKIGNGSYASHMNFTSLL
ncbi:MAG TPA: glycine oxidase ThiO [Candidatus Kapabacteria bacterium]|jgi:glycine oxidase|nr:glycine oxidase ThiO [Candidatus Kapabacteria bacterium]